MIYAPFVLVAVLVSARSRAELIPNVSDISDSVQHPPGGHAEVTEQSDEERVGPSLHLDLELSPSFLRNGESSATPLAPIPESSIPSLTHDKGVAELLSSKVPNKDVSHLKNNKELTQRMEELGINLDDVVAVVQMLQTRGVFSTHEFSDYSLTLMALGSVYFKNFESSSTEIKELHIQQFKSVLGKYADSPEFRNWIANHSGPRRLIQKVYGKMVWLVKFGGLKNCEKQDLADMAFGSEFFKIHKIDLSLLLPNSETLYKPKHRIQHLINRDGVDNRVKDKLRAFAEDPDSFDYSVEELLRRAKDADLEDEFTQIKRNQAFTQRMETLGINIDDAKVDFQMLRTRREFDNYDDDNLALMILGSKYFKKIKEKEGSRVQLGLLTKNNLARKKDGYVKTKEFQEWNDKHTIHGMAMKHVYGKMFWLMEKENLDMTDKELAEMAFGSEFFRQKSINLDKERPKYLITLLKEQGGVEPEVVDTLEKQMTEDPTFFTGKNAELFERKVKHLLLGADLEQETRKRRKIA